MHAHHCKIISLVGNCNVERRISISLFEESENGFRVSKDILGANESSHCSFDAHYCSFSRNSCGCSFRVAQLLTSSDGSPRNVMGNKHADSVFDINGCSSNQSSINADGGNSTMDDMIDFICFKRKDFTKPASNLILQGHSFEGHFSINAAINMRSSYNDWIKVIMSELSGSSSGLIGIAKNCSVRIPLSYS